MSFFSSASCNLVLDNIMQEKFSEKIQYPDFKSKVCFCRILKVFHALSEGAHFWLFWPTKKTLNLPDYCPIISRIKFWWISFFLNLKTDLRKPRYHLITKATFAPKNLGGKIGTFEFLHSDLLWLCIWYFSVFVCVYLSLCLCVFRLFFVFLSF